MADDCSHRTARSGRWMCVSNNHQNLKVFLLADSLVPRVYRWSTQLPADERFGLTSQIRRASVSVATNIVEGCARSSLPDYMRFLVIALGSSSETGYLVGLSSRLDFPIEASPSIVDGYDHVTRCLQSMITQLEQKL